jgi:hypothetical protein
MAALLAFTSVAQAKGKKPGDDNPGTQTINYPFITWGWADGGDSCWDRSRWCESAYIDVDGDAGIGGDLDAFSAAFARARLRCTAGAHAIAGYDTYYVGGGNLQLNNHGLNGSMHHIELFAAMLTGSAHYVEAGTFANSIARGSAAVRGGVRDMEEVCDSTNIGGTPFVDLCNEMTANVFGRAGASADAAAYSGGFAGAGSESNALVGLWNGVWAANIEEYHAIVGAGAGQFTYASSGTTASAHAAAFADTFLRLYVDACTTTDPDVGVIELCNEGAAKAVAFADAHADSFAASSASALTATHASMLMKATYINENGGYENDTIFFGGFGTAEEDLGDFNVSCYAPDRPAPPPP